MVVPERGNVGGKRALEVRLIGGLGNQLFQYAAGRYVSRHQGSQLFLNARGVYRRRGGQKSWIGNSGIDVGIRGRPWPTSFGTKMTNTFRSVNSTLNSKTLLNLDPKTNHYFRSKVLGFDIELESTLGSVAHLEGFFQSYRYVEPVVDELRLSILPKKRSRWFENFAQQIEESPNAVGLHVRRGDYRHAGNASFGLLSFDFFQNALERIQDSQLVDKVFIFSDDTEFVKREFLGLSSTGRIVHVDSESSPSSIESLVLMSQLKSLVISNSSYSWWAAALSSANSRIIAPDKWFRGAPDPEALLFPSWQRQQSIWVS
jgi:hypothetical protein